MTIDYSVYLVTDSNIAKSANKTTEAVVEEACRAGVGIVQLREKELNTREFVALAARVLEITNKYSTPLLINDRVDVALAVGCAGVHIGQGDMDYATARRLLGPKAIIGVTVANADQALQAHKAGADYLGIGACFDTSTKRLEKIPWGPFGLREIIKAVPAGVKSVVIGGIKTKNAARVLQISRVSPEKVCSGVAVVSEIMGARDVGSVVAGLKAAVAAGLDPGQALVSHSALSMSVAVSNLVKTLRATTPLVHHITNFVVMNDTANATLALGASPIMAQNVQEAGDLGRIVGALLLNYGTLNQEFIDGMFEAGRHANSNGVPVVFDPVGAGASELRKRTMRALLTRIKMDVVKGNAGEISAVVGSGEVEMRGVDSVGDMKDPAVVVAKAARQEHCVVAMTGVVDYVSDGERTYAIRNGHEWLGKITGSGCMATTAIASYCAVAGQDPLVGAIAGLVSVGVAAEIAATRPDVHGPSSFKTAFLDELYNLTPEKLAKMGRIEQL
ncbi:hypothetical protein HDU91_007414 [Kappamyces sp. JEL0680]|nr:hypothetical protein HDU91_007414 [Kappamyces sp. JEL0680]